MFHKWQIFLSLKVYISFYFFSAKKPKRQGGGGGGDIPPDPANMPKWMQDQMGYVEQMQEYMQQCHQFAQVY